MFRDPGERYPIGTHTEEYHKQVGILKNVEAAHVRKRIYAQPQLNWCDRSVEVKLQKIVYILQKRTTARRDFMQ